MPPAARLTDYHVCPMLNPDESPHVGGPIVTGEPTVLVGFQAAARVSDSAVCIGPPDVIVKGAPTVLIGYLQAARIGDQTAHGGVIVMGCPTVLIGESGSGGFGGANTPCGAAAKQAKKSRAAMRKRIRHQKHQEAEANARAEARAELAASEAKLTNWEGN